MYLNPAQYVIQMFGSIRKTAKTIGRTRGAVTNWGRPKNKGGNGGDVPGPSQRIILRIAKERGLDITPNDLAYGRNTKTLER